MDRIPFLPWLPWLLIKFLIQTWFCSVADLCVHSIALEIPLREHSSRLYYPIFPAL